MTELPFPLAGSTLIVGPSQAGKTRLTARALEAWVNRHGTDGLVVLEFAPELERDGRLLGGRVDRFTTIPRDVWHGVLDAHAPRAEGIDEGEAVALAKDNAKRGLEILEAAPNPTAIFVNDATIPLQHESVDVKQLTEYFDRATCVVLNAFDSDELGTEDSVSRQERTALSELRSWADRTVELD